MNLLMMALAIFQEADPTPTDPLGAVGKVFSEVLPYGALGSAMLYSWRMTHRAQSDAGAIRAKAYEDAQSDWEQSRTVLLTENKRLRELVAKHEASALHEDPTDPTEL